VFATLFHDVIWPDDSTSVIAAVATGAPLTGTPLSAGRRASAPLLLANRVAVSLYRVPASAKTAKIQGEITSIKLEVVPTKSGEHPFGAEGSVTKQ
jgi:hypothetical protein